MDNDANEATGIGTDTIYINDKEVEVKGIDKIETFERNTKGQTLQIDYDNTGDGDPNSTTYLVLDQYGRAVARYFNNDSNDATGKEIPVEIDGKQVKLKGIDSFETYEYNANGQQIQINRNLNARDASDGEAFKNDKGFEEVIYIDRDEYGREKGRYTDLDNDKDTGTGNKDQDAAIKLRDGRELKGIDRYETYEHDEGTGHHIQTNKNFDAKGAFEEVEYRDVDSASGQLMGVYYNRDNDMKDGVALKEKTGETIELENGRRFEGIDNYTTYERDTQNRVITERFNFDAKGDYDRVYYYDLDANGNRIGEYQNLDNDTTLTLEGEKQVTGTTHTLEDGRTVHGIERYYEQKFDGNNRLYERTSNLDGKDHAESVSYYVRDELGREIARYDNTNNDVLSSGKPNPTGHTHTIMLNGKLTEVTGIDRIAENTHNEYGQVTKTRTNNTGEAGEEFFTNITDNVYNERRQKVEDRSQVKIKESGEFEQSAANKYTYDIYGRQATRAFDTDFSEGKAGAERIDTYHRDSYGNIEREDRNFTGDDLPINEYTTREFDLYGREEVRRVFDSQDRLTSKNVSKFDLYNQSRESTSYSNEDTINIRSIFVRDEYGRMKVEGRDRNLDGELNLGDTWRTYSYNDQGQAYKVTDTQANGSVTPTIWAYDDFGRRSYTYQDFNNNEQWDNGETKHVDIRFADGLTDEVRRFIAPDDVTPVHIYKYVYINAGNQGTTIGSMTAPEGKEFTSFAYNVYGSQVNSVEDYTTDSWKSFFNKVGGSIEVINMTDARAKTEITLDNDILSKITGSQLRIAGDATDTVNLKDSAEFTKLEGTKRVSGNDYHQYETQVGEGTYTLLIDTDVNINLL
ncbi:hypothetical protein [Mannheimia indoligenes]|uniref:hypothetical protein n=1 Tax=Mannheimia indoligenes TaxID=3103145 RepID=UPI002FE5DF18